MKTQAHTPTPRYEEESLPNTQKSVDEIFRRFGNPIVCKSCRRIFDSDGLIFCKKCRQGVR